MVSSYYEVGFLTESELVRYIGAGSKALGLGKPSTLQLEDGSGTLQGWHISLAGCPPHFVAAIRKIRVESSLSLAQYEILLSPLLQMRAEQAAETLCVALKKNVAERCTAERSTPNPWGDDTN